MNSSQSSRPYLRIFSGSPQASQLSDDKRSSASGPRVADSAAKTRRGVSEKELDRAVGLAPSRRVEVSLGEIAPVLFDAINHQRGWLSDFADDTVSIDADLYEVLLAYQQLRRLNAA